MRSRYVGQRRCGVRCSVVLSLPQGQDRMPTVPSQWVLLGLSDSSVRHTKIKWKWRSFMGIYTHHLLSAQLLLFALICCCYCGRCCYAHHAHAWALVSVRRVWLSRAVCLWVPASSLPTFVCRLFREVNAKMCRVECFLLCFYRYTWYIHPILNRHTSSLFLSLFSSFRFSILYPICLFA